MAEPLERVEDERDEREVDGLWLLEPLEPLEPPVDGRDVDPEGDGVAPPACGVPGSLENSTLTVSATRTTSAMTDASRTRRRRQYTDDGWVPTGRSISTATVAAGPGAAGRDARTSCKDAPRWAS